MTNKVVLITGAASGIGKSTAELLYNRGFKIIAAGIRMANLEKAFPDFPTEKLICLPLDVSKAEDWENVCNESVKHFGKIDILVNSAGVIEPGYVLETTVKNIDKQIDINLKGCIYGTHIVSKYMIQRGGGHIINISSMAGIAPIPGISVYSATKFGVRGFSLSAADELKDSGIWVSVVSPDAVKTRMLDQQKAKKEAALIFSANKYLTPADVAKAVVSIIEKPRYEIWLPFSRGVLGTIGTAFPRLTRKIKSLMIKKGLKRQRVYNG